MQVYSDVYYRTIDYADPIITDIDPLNLVSHRLYRNHTLKLNKAYIKDLEIIGRPLESTIIVDNTKENFKYQKKNGIQIKDWVGDYEDDRLKKLSVVLIQIAKMNKNLPIKGSNSSKMDIGDIREELQLYRRYLRKYIQ